MDFGTDRVDADCLKITDVAANSTGDGVAKNPPFLPSGASNSDALKIGTLPPSGLVFSAGDTGTKLGSTKAKGWKKIARAKNDGSSGSEAYTEVDDVGKKRLGVDEHRSEFGPKTKRVLADLTNTSTSIGSAEVAMQPRRVQ